MNPKLLTDVDQKKMLHIEWEHEEKMLLVIWMDTKQQETLVLAFCDSRPGDPEIDFVLNKV